MVALAVLTVAGALGCSSKPGPDKRARAAAGSQERSKASVELPFVDEKTTISASQILVGFAAAERAPAGVTRTKEEALARAKEALGKVRAGADFAEVAREYSDDASRERGGDLGSFTADSMFPSFSEAVRGLAVGQISEPVETPAGFHILKRNELERIYTRHIMVQHAGIKQRLPGVKRTKKQARARIERVAREMREPGANFFKLARKYSDCMSRRCGGNLKPIGRLGILPRFEETAFNLELWEVSDIIETRFGFHIIQRIP